MNGLSPVMFTTAIIILNIILIVMLIQRTILSGNTDLRSRRLRHTLNIASALLFLLIAGIGVHNLNRTSPDLFASIGMRRTPVAAPTTQADTSSIASRADVSQVVQSSPTLAAQATRSTQTPLSPAFVPTNTPTRVAPRPTATDQPAPPSAEPTATDQPAPPSAEPAVPPPQPTTLPSIGSGSPFITDTFTTNGSGWIVYASDTWSANYVRGMYSLTLSGQNFTSVSFPSPVEHYTLSFDIMSTSGAAGVVFLSAEPATFYYFLIDQGRFALQRYEQHQKQTTNVIDWTTSAAIYDTVAGRNRIRIVRNGSTIQFFANGAQLTTWTVPDHDVYNQIGFALSSDTGQAQALFDNLVGYELDLP